MSAISLKLPDDLLEASNRCAVALKLSRAAYIRRAVERMNRETRLPEVCGKRPICSWTNSGPSIIGASHEGN